jgi:hypothetical protein
VGHLQLILCFDVPRIHILPDHPVLFEVFVEIVGDELLQLVVTFMPNIGIHAFQDLIGEGQGFDLLVVFQELLGGHVLGQGGFQRAAAVKEVQFFLMGLGVCRFRLEGVFEILLVSHSVDLGNA